ncbi:MAG: FAD-dependent oxidoreductase [Nanoarchaeota archaeon]
MKIKHEVFWKNPGYKGYPKLKENIECDYLIVGGGISGVSLAYFLATLGNKKVVLIEKDKIGSGATSNSAGMLTVKAELDITNIFDILGRKKGLEYWEANKKGLEIVRHIIAREGIHCDYEPNNTLFGNIQGDQNHSYMTKEYLLEKALDEKAKFMIGDDIKKELNTSLFDQAILSYDHGISVNPVKHVQELARVTSKKGVHFYENTKLTSYNKDTAIVNNHKVKFNKIILAIDKDFKHPHVKSRRSTLVVTAPLSEKEIEDIGMKTKKFVWDSRDEYAYLKITKENRLMVGFGDLFIKRKNKKISPHTHHLNEIISFIKKLFPQLNVRPEYAWSGVFSTSKNLLPVIHENNSRISVAGAGSQVVCVLASHHIAHKLMGGKSPLDKILKNAWTMKPKGDSTKILS